MYVLLILIVVCLGLTLMIVGNTIVIYRDHKAIDRIIESVGSVVSIVEELRKEVDKKANKKKTGNLGIFDNTVNKVIKRLEKQLKAKKRSGKQIKACKNGYEDKD